MELDTITRLTQTKREYLYQLGDVSNTKNQAIWLVIAPYPIDPHMSMSSKAKTNLRSWEKNDLQETLGTPEDSPHKLCYTRPPFRFLAQK